MSWHPDCYRQEYGADGFPRTSKFRTSCRAGNRCLHGGYIETGAPFSYDKPGTFSTSKSSWSSKSSWTRQHTPPPPITTPVLSSPVLPSGPTAAEVAQALTKELIAREVAQQIQPEALAEQITLQVLDKIASVTAVRVEIKNLAGEVKDVGLQHKQFPILLKTVAARVNAWLAGPSGSGKTTSAQNVAKALELPFRYTGAVGDPYALMGYNDAHGKYVRTPFREAWEHGGVFLWDEVDASDPNALLAFNAALANGTAPFPDGCIEKHPDCVLIAAANTWGHGATHEYVGRLKMDAAFLKRFAFIAWDYDEQLEVATAPNKEWTHRVQSIRSRVRAKGLRVLVTPRESYLGARLLAAGIPQSTVEQMTVKSGMTDAQWEEVRR
jgi:cobaltochelatase CobS